MQYINMAVKGVMYSLGVPADFEAGAIRVFGEIAESLNSDGNLENAIGCAVAESSNASEGITSPDGSETLEHTVTDGWLGEWGSDPCDLSQLDDYGEILVVAFVNLCRVQWREMY